MTSPLYREEVSSHVPALRLLRAMGCGTILPKRTPKQGLMQVLLTGKVRVGEVKSGQA